MIEILRTVGCGNMETGIDSMIPQFITSIVRILQIGIPVILVVLGMLDLGKAVTSNDDKQMKEAQKLLIKRIVYAVLIFFVIAIVKFVFGMLSSSTADGQDEQNTGTATKCIDCFLNYSDDNKSCAEKNNS